MQAQQNVLPCLPLLADILGKSYGVTVAIGGNDAYTDGRTITLPSLPLTDDPDFIGLVRGFLDHESAHIRHTDLEAVAAENPTPLEQKIWNTLEDWRVETELSRLFPGCAGNFRWLINHLFMGRGKDDSLFPVLDWLLFTVRSWSAPEIIPDRDLLAHQVEADIPGLIWKLAPLLVEVKRNSPDSMACLNHARKIVRLLVQTAEEIRHNKQKGGKDRKDDPMVLSEKQAAQALKMLDAVLKASESKLGDDLGDILKELLKESIRAMPQEIPRVRMAQEENSPLIPMDAKARQAAHSTATGLRARLHGMIQATKLVRHAPSRRGKLDCHRLYGVAVNDPRLFRAHRPKSAINTAIHLLLDASGSMHSRMLLASQCCLALAQALEQSGVSVGITAFHGKQEGKKLVSLPMVTPILRHGERVETVTGTIGVQGDTPLAQGLWWVLPRLMERKEVRKIVFVVTDGMPDSVPMAEQAIAGLEKLGVEIYALGIRSSRIGELFQDKSINVLRLDELSQAMFGLVSKVLLKGNR